MAVTSMRGRRVDMMRLAALNQHKAALNGRPRNMANMNARGDILVRGAVAVPREQITLDYNRRNPKAIVKHSSLRDISKEVMTFNTPQQIVAQQREMMMQKPNKTKRKIVDD